MAKEITEPTDEHIRTRAYYLWEADGRPEGRDCEYWLRAKQELAATAPQPKANGASAKKINTANGEATAPATKRRSTSRTQVYA